MDLIERQEIIDGFLLLQKHYPQITIPSPEEYQNWSDDEYRERYIEIIRKIVYDDSCPQKVAEQRQDIINRFQFLKAQYPHITIPSPEESEFWTNGGYDRVFEHMVEKVTKENEAEKMKEMIPIYNMLQPYIDSITIKNFPKYKPIDELLLMTKDDFQKYLINYCSALSIYHIFVTNIVDMLYILFIHILQKIRQQHETLNFEDTNIYDEEIRILLKFIVVDSLKLKGDEYNDIINHHYTEAFKNKCCFDKVVSGCMIL